VIALLLLSLSVFPLVLTLLSARYASVTSLQADDERHHELIHSVLQSSQDAISGFTNLGNRLEELVALQRAQQLAEDEKLQAWAELNRSIHSKLSEEAKVTVERLGKVKAPTGTNAGRMPDAHSQQPTAQLARRLPGNFGVQHAGNGFPSQPAAGDNISAGTAADIAANKQLSDDIEARRRARTRDLFAKRWGTYGMPSMKTYLTTFKRGDIVDIVANPAIHKGFPFKHYQGKTGVIWNVTKTSVGVIMNKKVGNRIIKKRLHLRIEHVKHSKSRMGFLKRVTENEEKRKQAKATGTKIPLKRSPVQPIGGHIIKAKQRPSELLRPVKFEFIA